MVLIFSSFRVDFLSLNYHIVVSKLDGREPFISERKTRAQIGNLIWLWSLLNTCEHHVFFFVLNINITS